VASEIPKQLDEFRQSRTRDVVHSLFSISMISRHEMDLYRLTKYALPAFAKRFFAKRSTCGESPAGSGRARA
jgi:hypothetical protein